MEIVDKAVAVLCGFAVLYVFAQLIRVVFFID